MLWSTLLVWKRVLSPHFTPMGRGSSITVISLYIFLNLTMMSRSGVNATVPQSKMFRFCFAWFETLPPRQAQTQYTRYNYNLYFSLTVKVVSFDNTCSCSVIINDWYFVEKYTILIWYMIIVITEYSINCACYASINYDDLSAFNVLYERVTLFCICIICMTIPTAKHCTSVPTRAHRAFNVHGPIRHTYVHYVPDPHITTPPPRARSTTEDAEDTDDDDDDAVNGGLAACEHNLKSKNMNLFHFSRQFNSVLLRENVVVAVVSPSPCDWKLLKRSLIWLSRLRQLHWNTSCCLPVCARAHLIYIP